MRTHRLPLTVALRAPIVAVFLVAPVVAAPAAGQASHDGPRAMTHEPEETDDTVGS